MCAIFCIYQGNQLNDIDLIFECPKYYCAYIIEDAVIIIYNRIISFEYEEDREYLITKLIANLKMYLTDDRVDRNAEWMVKITFTTLINLGIDISTDEYGAIDIKYIRTSRLCNAYLNVNSFLSRKFINRDRINELKTLYLCLNRIGIILPYEMRIYIFEILMHICYGSFKLQTKRPRL